MRCKVCLRTFTQPSSETKETQTCSICRGVRAGSLKQRELCERTPMFIVVRIKNAYNFDTCDHDLIQPMQPVYRKVN